MSFDDTQSFSEALRDVYEQSGYVLVHVPGARSKIALLSFASSARRPRRPLIPDGHHRNRPSTLLMRTPVPAGNLRDVRSDELERRLRARLDALGPTPRAELLHVLMLPDLERVGMIQSYWGNSATRTFADLLIDCEEDRTLRAVLVGMLQEIDYRTRRPGLT